MKKTGLIISALAAVFCCHAAAPSGYYNEAENKSERNLLIALNGIISDHTTLSYKSLNDYYPKTDAYPDGKLWDIYSTKHWNKGEKCGNYSVVGDCYNKEHSFPKSWFDDASPMYSDLHHLYPTDGKVNGQRSNHPYGECSGGTTLPGTGSVKRLGRLGRSTFSGYSGTVFEPDNEYKGDLARTYFYMAACYYHRNSSWHSDMLAGNNFPFFKPWAINLLLKWHRQDPVSQREKTRNDAVYAAQHNRNPFIDHPELAEYIWGDKKGSVWTSTGVVETRINTPVSGSTIDMGLSGCGVAIEQKVAVRTTNATDAVSISVSTPFSVAPSTLTATAANNGTEITLRYQSTTEAVSSATLTISAGNAKSTVTVKAQAIDGLPVMQAENITDRSFDARWTYIGDADADGNYTLTVSDDAGPLPGYPRKVTASAGRYTVDGLMADADYTYSLNSQSMVSDYISVRTAEAVPMIEFLFDGDLFFSTAPGEPSEVAELLVAAENISTDINLSVKAPFELSLDRSNWSTQISISPDEDRIYLRLYSQNAGSFESPITAVAGSYFNDNTVVSGNVSATVSFFEDFEAEGKYDTYSPQTYMGVAGKWNLNDAGIWTADGGHDGSKQSLRAGRNGSALIELADAKKGGAGTISFFAARWTANEALPELIVEVSSDEGKTWKNIGSVAIEDAAWKQYTFTASTPGNILFRLRQSAGRRFNIDDIAVTDYTSGVDEPYAERHLWDAYCLGGQLTVEVKTAAGIEAAIYAVDGRTVFAGRLPEGVHSFDNIAPGMVVIVNSGDFSRTVLIK